MNNTNSLHQNVSCWLTLQKSSKKLSFHKSQKKSGILTTNTPQLAEEDLEVAKFSFKLELNDDFLQAETIMN